MRKGEVVKRDTTHKELAWFTIGTGRFQVVENTRMSSKLQHIFMQIFISIRICEI